MDRIVGVVAVPAVAGEAARLFTLLHGERRVAVPVAVRVPIEVHEHAVVDLAVAIVVEAVADLVDARADLRVVVVAVLVLGVAVPVVVHPEQ